MPRYAATGAVPDWDALYEEARAETGHFTAADAARHRISGALLRYHLAQGHLQKEMRGVYRFARHPLTQEDSYVVAWLWTGRVGVVSHDSALQLHELSDAMPRHVHLTVPLAWRRRRLKVPRLVMLHFADLPQADRSWYGPVPITSVLRTLMDAARGETQPEYYLAAVRDVRARGLLTEAQLEGVFRVATWPGGEREGRPPR